MDFDKTWVGLHFGWLVLQHIRSPCYIQFLPVSGYCNATWDGFLCWPMTAPGETPFICKIQGTYIYLPHLGRLCIPEFVQFKGQAMKPIVLWWNCHSSTYTIFMWKHWKSNKITIYIYTSRKVISYKVTWYFLMISNKDFCSNWFEWLRVLHQVTCST
jgi:hypothetical protein